MLRGKAIVLSVIYTIEKAWNWKVQVPVLDKHNFFLLFPSVSLQERINMRLLRIATYCALALFLATACNIKKAAETRGAEADTLAHALLWKIEKPDMEQASYLFGTIHIIPAEDFFWPNGTLAAFDASQQVIFEVDMDIMQDMSAIMEIRDRMFMPGDTSLSMLYSEEEYAEVKKYFKEQGMPVLFLEKIKPLFLSAMVGVDISGGSLGDNADIKSYEMALQKMVETSRNENGERKEVIGLETMDMQMSMIDKVPLNVQADMLLAAIEAELQGENQFNAIAQLYVSQNINAMVEDVASSQKMGKFSKVLLDDRNKSWIPIIDSLIHKKPSFIAVGAGHLGGKNGVINLLRRAGYTLTPLSEVKAIEP